MESKTGKGKQDPRGCVTEVAGGDLGHNPIANAETPPRIVHLKDEGWDSRPALAEGYLQKHELPQIPGHTFK